jgi:hypothetical protein
MGKWFAPNALSLSHSLEGIGRPLIQLLFCLNNRNHPQIQTHSEISRSAISNKALPTQVRVSCTKSSGKLIFSDDDSVLVTITNSKNVDCDLTFEASCSSSEPRLLTQDHNDLVRDFNLSKSKLDS